ncbi:MAG: hypothetical protein JWP97_6611 [Labilithrix sp.]|nr:hypothetical protein [Labilithrix sp.]
MSPSPLQRQVAGHRADDDEITIERRVRLPAPGGELVSSRKTTKMGAVDARLLAIARGEEEPDTLRPPPPAAVAADDPFGGLIPVDDDGEACEIDDDWLFYDDAPEPAPPVAIFLTSVPRLRVTSASLVSLPLDARSGFLLSHIDGLRTVEELIDAASLPAEDALEVLALLANLGAIAVD